MPQRVPIVDYLVLDLDPHLEAKECQGCAALWFDRRNGCGGCGGSRFQRRPLATAGVVHTFTIVHRAAPGVTAPYVSAVVALDGGGWVKANLVNVAPTPDEVRLGMPVRLTTFTAGVDDDGVEAVGFGFEPARPTETAA